MRAVLPTAYGNVCQSLGSHAFRHVHQGVDLLSWHVALSLYVDGPDRTAGGKGSCKYAESAALHQLRNIFQLHAEPDIRFVGTETVHRLPVRHPQEWNRNLHAQDLAEQKLEELFIDIHHVLFGHEGELHVHLGKIRLTVRAQILIPETAGDLEIAVIPGAHQKLLKQLRRLGQRVKRPRMQTARNQIVPRALRRALGQHRRLNL